MLLTTLIDRTYLRRHSFERPLLPASNEIKKNSSVAEYIFILPGFQDQPLNQDCIVHKLMAITHISFISS